LTAPSDEELRECKGHVQLNLFQDGGQAVIDRLKQLDISTMTPVEALNHLNELQEKVKAP
jgi:hypothetical protein